MGHAHMALDDTSRPIPCFIPSLEHLRSLTQASLYSAKQARDQSIGMTLCP